MGNKTSLCLFERRVGLRIYKLPACCAKVSDLSVYNQASGLNPCMIWQNNLSQNMSNQEVSKIKYIFLILKVSHRVLYHMLLQHYYLRSLPGLNFKEYGRKRSSHRKSNALLLWPTLWSKRVFFGALFFFPCIHFERCLSLWKGDELLLSIPLDWHLKPW